VNTRTPPRTRALAALLGAGLLLGGCAATGVRLAEPDRAALRKQPAIHVLHYETPLPELKASNKSPPPSAADIRRTAGADPAALVAAQFARLMGKREKLKNLKVEPHHLPRPVAASALELKPKYARGLALELWVDRWAFEAVAGDPGRYGLRLDGRARLSRLDDGRVLWSTGQCRVGGHTSRDYAVAVADLTNTVRLRKLLATARNECARQLARDFDTPANKKG
jgi:hypothetical protein